VTRFLSVKLAQFSVTTFDRIMRSRALFTILPLVLILAFCVPAACAATANCPWLNAATAAGVLEGSVTTTVTHAGQNNNSDDATCEFIHRAGSTVTELQIEVGTMKDPARDFASYVTRCEPNATQLRGIGNEAFVCSLQEKKKQISEQVVSRVRDRAFVVRVSSNAPLPPQNDLREKARKTAEQVAGFLF
jgi:hypothetical protein